MKLGTLTPSFRLGSTTPSRIYLGTNLVWSSFSPLSLSPALWLDASDASKLYDATAGGSLVVADGTVARWEDKSGNARHATQATGESRPLRKTAIQNGRDVVRFDGSNDAINLSDLSFLNNAAPFDVLLVMKTTQASFGSIFSTQTAATDRGVLLGLNNTSPNYPLLRLQSDSGRRQIIATTTPVSSGSAVLLQSTYQGGGAGVSALSIRVNSIAQAVNQTNTHSGEFQKTTDGTIGDRNINTLPLTGDIAEILIFPTALSTADRQSVESYLNAKWAIY